MGAPLISLVQDAAIELGLPLPQQVIRANDNTGRQMGGLATRVGRLLLRAHDWTVLTGQWEITMPPPLVMTGTTTAGSTTITALPPGQAVNIRPGQMMVTGQGIMTATRVLTLSADKTSVTTDVPATVTVNQPLSFLQDSIQRPVDFERFINRTQWDRSMRWELRGPQTPQSDQWVRSGIVAIGPRRQYRWVDGMLRIWPVPYSGVGSGAGVGGGVLVTEYISNFFVQDAVNGAGKARFTADLDTCAFADDIMIMGLKYLFFSVKGFDTSDLFKQFQLATQNAIASDGPSPTLDMDRTRFPIFISPSNVQDADFPGSFGNR